MIDAFRVLDSKGRYTTDRKIPDGQTKTDVNHENGRNPGHSRKRQRYTYLVNAKTSQLVIKFVHINVFFFYLAYRFSLHPDCA